VLRARQEANKLEEILKKTWAKMDPKNNGKIKLSYFIEIFSSKGEPLTNKEMDILLGDKKD